MESNTIASKNFSWNAVNWDALRRLRTRFLQFSEGQRSGAGDYWRSHSELESYDFTFAERIGWKWDTVLAELAGRGWTLPEGSVLDYGCGTGVAGRRVIAWARENRCANAAAVSKLLLWDRSRPALNFAFRRARETFPELAVEIAATGCSAATLVISHVLNELSSEGLEQLLAVASRAKTVLWVEPGTALVSRALIAARERLVPAFHPIAPCTHALPCGMLTPGNERHWCHHFATVPRSVFQDAGWGRFAKTLEIDLGTVPFSYLVLDRRPDAPRLPGASRVIGEPRQYKGFTKVLSCQDDGVRELILQKRDAPELIKKLKKEPGSLYRWERDGERIRGRGKGDLRTWVVRHRTARTGLILCRNTS